MTLKSRCFDGHDNFPFMVSLSIYPCWTNALHHVLNLKSNEIHVRSLSLSYLGYDKGKGLNRQPVFLLRD